MDRDVSILEEIAILEQKRDDLIFVFVNADEMEILNEELDKLEAEIEKLTAIFERMKSESEYDARF